MVEIEIEKSVQSGAKTGKITIETTEMESIYDLGQKMIESIQKEKIGTTGSCTLVSDTNT